jgi:hypothetical protein
MIKWHFEKEGLTREQADQRVLDIGFSPENATRGWRRKVDCGRRGNKHRKHNLHIVPCSEGFDIHEDSKGKHKVVKYPTAVERCKEILRELKGLKSRMEQYPITKEFIDGFPAYKDLFMLEFCPMCGLVPNKLEPLIEEIKKMHEDAWKYQELNK